jgi:hypothetical protein
VNVIDPARLTGHPYRVTFQAGGSLTYTVSDLATGDTLLREVELPRGTEMEGPPFDGVRLFIRDVDTIDVMTDSTQWVVGSSALIPSVFLPRFDPGGGLITGTPYPADYDLTITDAVVGTSSSLFGWQPLPMRFRVRNVTEGRDVEVLFTDVLGNVVLDYPDDITILEPDSLGQLMPSWALWFGGDPGAIPPVAGDVFRLRVRKPLTVRDVYEFTAAPGGVTAVPSPAAPVQTYLDVNYPNPFNAVTTIRYVLGESAGKPDVRLSVFDVLGREVAVLVNGPQSAGVHTVRFNAPALSSGMYFSRLTAAGISMTRKMVLAR